VSAFHWITDPGGWIALVTLTAMEIVLGIDNVIFISLLVSRLDPARARRIGFVGLALALGLRAAFLFTLTFLIGLTAPLFLVLDHPVSARDIVLVIGGLFLVWNATVELHDEFEVEDEEDENTPVPKVSRSVAGIILKIALIDLVFSVDSTVTAIGMAQDLSIMIIAVFLSMIAMYSASTGVADFIRRHPTSKVLALAFLVLIGAALIADGSGYHIPRGYIYFAMAFSALIEVFNVAARSRRRRRR
jgi:predicted tellurium resistance membrane protein TerC